MNRQYSKWIVYLLDLISSYDINEIENDKQMNEIRCMLYSDIRSNLIKCIYAKKLVIDSKLDEKLVYAIFYRLYTMFNIIPAEIGELTKPYADYIDFKPCDTFKLRVLNEKNIFKTTFIEQFC